MGETPPAATTYLPPAARYYSDDELLDRVAHHPPSSPDIIAGHTLVRDLYGNLLVALNGLLAEGSHKTRCLEELIDNMNKANAIIATTQTVHAPLGAVEVGDGE